MLSFDLYVHCTYFSGYSGSQGDAFQAMDLDGDKNFRTRYMYFSVPTLLADGLAEYCKMFFSMALSYTCSMEIILVSLSNIVRFSVLAAAFQMTAQ